VRSYEFVRAGSTTQFTLRFGASMLPAAISLVPLAAVGLLTLYRWLLINHGPYGALVVSTLLCAGGLFVTSLGALSGFHTIEFASVWMLYLFRYAIWPAMAAAAMFVGITAHRASFCFGVAGKRTCRLCLPSTGLG